MKNTLMIGLLLNLISVAAFASPGSTTLSCVGGALVLDMSESRAGNDLSLKLGQQEIAWDEEFSEYALGEVSAQYATAASVTNHNRTSFNVIADTASIVTDPASNVCQGSQSFTAQIRGQLASGQAFTQAVNCTLERIAGSGCEIGE